MSLTYSDHGNGGAIFARYVLRENRYFFFFFKQKTAYEMIW